MFFKELKSSLNSKEVKANDNTIAANMPAYQLHNKPNKPNKKNNNPTLRKLNKVSFTKTINCLSWDTKIEPNIVYNVLNKQNPMNERM